MLLPDRIYGWNIVKPMDWPMHYKMARMTHPITLNIVKREKKKIHLVFKISDRPKTLSSGLHKNWEESQRILADIGVEDLVKSSTQTSMSSSSADNCEYLKV